MLHRAMTPAAVLGRAGWTIRRFGLTPHGAWARLSSDASKVLCISIPKAGTHLLERALCLHPAFHRRFVRTLNETNLRRLGGLARLLEEVRPGQVLMGHLGFSDSRWEAIENHRVRSVFMIRDPRDIVVSSAMYISHNPRHGLHDLFRAKKTLAQRLRLAIEGCEERGFPSVRERVRRHLGWLGSGSLVVRFEDLVGELGGGTELVQRQTLRSVYGYLGVDSGEELVGSISERLFSPLSPTFRRGRVGGWRDYFDADLESRFMELAGDTLALFGYSAESSAETRISPSSR